MHLDVLDLRNFYYHTPLGRVAQRAIRDCVTTAWTPEQVRGQTVAGFGFSVPLLRPYLRTARRVIGLMPGPQGVMPWPAGRPNVSVLCEETLWPLETGHVDRLILMHGLETSERPTAVLDEAQRVLGPGGRALFIVPNRAGLWARGDGTPYGFGRPYSLGQLEDQLRRHDFVPERHLTALFTPPSSRRFWLKSADLWERVGRRLSTILAGGVFMVEASKRNPPQRRATDRVALRILDSVSTPVAEPA